MKKNAMLKVAAGLMVAVLLTTCAISSTFAKYVSSEDLAGATPVTADVADWALNFEATNTGFFATSYQEKDALSAPDADGTLVIANATTNVLAPGLADSGTIGYTISGKSDVAFQVTLAADVEITGFDTYCPIVFTVGSAKYAFDATKGAAGTADAPTLVEGINYVKDITELETAIEKAVAATAPGQYEPRAAADAAIEVAAATSFGWSWAFESGNDEADTDLGELGTAAVSIKMAATVEQINDFASNN